MDIFWHMRDQNLYVFFWRSENVALEKIDRNSRIVVASADAGQGN